MRATGAAAFRGQREAEQDQQALFQVYEGERRVGTGDEEKLRAVGVGALHAGLEEQHAAAAEFRVAECLVNDDLGRLVFERGDGEPAVGGAEDHHLVSLREQHDTVTRLAGRHALEDLPDELLPLAGVADHDVIALLDEELAGGALLLLEDQRCGAMMIAGFVAWRRPACVGEDGFAVEREVTRRFVPERKAARFVMLPLSSVWI